MTTDVTSTTMHFIGAQLFAWDSANRSRKFEDLEPHEREDWYRKAVFLIQAAEPLWMSRVAEDRAATVGTLQSLSRMAMVRGIPLLGRADSTYDREKIVQDWIAECAERYEKLGRV